MNQSLEDRQRWFNQLRAEWFRIMRPLGSWVPWELREQVQLEEVREESFWERGLMQPARQLRTEHLRNCVVRPNRIVLLEYLPHGGTVAEIGTGRGDFAREILRVANPRELHLVDHVVQPQAREMAEDPSFEGRVHVHKADSAEALESFPHAFFDWIYVDAQHTYEGVKLDIAAAKTKVKSGGYLVFNDYIMWSYFEMQPYGVVPAVNEFCIEHVWAFVYFTLPEHMYCDVAIRKIESAAQDQAE